MNRLELRLKILEVGYMKNLSAAQNIDIARELEKYVNEPEVLVKPETTPTKEEVPVVETKKSVQKNKGGNSILD